MEKTSSRKRSREASEDVNESSALQTKRLKLEDDVVAVGDIPVEEEEIDLPEELLLLEILDDFDVAESEGDLDSVIRSFEEEILQPEETIERVKRAELGFLLEASDDELGLPSADTKSEFLDVGFGEVGGLYDLGEFGIGEDLGEFDRNGMCYDFGDVEEEEEDCMRFDEGLFGNEFVERSEFEYRPEVLPAL